MLKNIFTVSFLTLISRVFGYIRDVVIAAKLGAGVYNDLFIVALRIPNFFRSIFGEGAFNIAFIPIYSGLLGRSGRQKSDAFAAKAHLFLIIVVAIFSVLLYFLMPQIIHFTVLGLEEPHLKQLQIEFARIAVPYLLFISLVAFYGGILNSLGNFYAFASAPIIINIVLIVVAYISAGSIEAKVRELSYSLVIGGVLECVWMLWFIASNKVNLHIISLSITEDLKELIYKIIPGVVGSGVAQINIFIDTIIASFVTGGISYLYYADRINQLPLALVAISIGTVMLPQISRKIAQGKHNEAIKMHNNTLIMLLAVALPSALGLAILAPDIISVLFKHGAFSEEAVIGSYKALQLFAIGLPAYMISKVYLANFYAHGDTKTPVKIAAGCIIINAAVGFLLLPLLGHLSVAIASSLAAWLNVYLLNRLIQKRGWFSFAENFIFILVRLAAFSIIMAAMVAILAFYLHGLILLLIAPTFGGMLYFGLIYIFKTINWQEIKNG